MERFLQRTFCAICRNVSKTGWRSTSFSTPQINGTKLNDDELFRANAMRPSLHRSTVKQILFGFLACVRTTADAVVHLSMTIQVRHVPVGSATARDGAMEWLLQGMLASPFPPVIHTRELKTAKTERMIRNRLFNAGRHHHKCWTN